MTQAEGAAISLIESGATCEVDLLDGKKYASLFHRTLHHNTGYLLQVIFLMHYSNFCFQMAQTEGAAISLIESGATCEVYLLDGKKYASKYSRSQH